MKVKIALIIFVAALASCIRNTDSKESKKDLMPIVGTWKLLSGTTIENGDTTVTPYSGNISFIKIINDTHFAFLQHDLSKGKDSSAVFAAGGGTYSLKDSVYTENLEYCSARDWEGNDFKFNISIKNDTLIQSGEEIVESAGVNRINIEKYVRLKK